MQKKVKITLFHSFLALSLLYPIVNTPFVVAEPDERPMALTDVNQEHWAYQVLVELIEKYNLKLGYDNRTFQGDKSITRYEVAALLLQILKKLAPQQIEPTDKALLEGLKNEFQADLEGLKKAMEILEDQVDTQAFDVAGLQEKLQGLENMLDAQLFGTLSLRSCVMSTKIFSEPQNIFSENNVRGNGFQVRMGGGIKGKIMDRFHYQLRLLTAANNTFNESWLPTNGSNLPAASLRLDRYFISYQPFDPKQSNLFLDLTFGKAANFFPETELLFDEDVSLNGLSQQVAFRNITPWWKELSFGLAQQVLLTEETYIKTSLLGAKLATEFRPWEQLHLQLGGAYLHYLGADSLARHNFSQGYPLVSQRNTGADKNDFEADFNLIDAFARITYIMGDTLPISLESDFVHNLGAKDNNQGFTVGVRVGHLQDPGDLSFSYNYKVLQRDYNISLLVPEQLAGTAVTGHEAHLGIQLASKTSLGFTLHTRHGIINPVDDLYIFYSIITQRF